MSRATIAPSLPQMARVFSDTANSEFLSKLILTIPALAVALSAPFAGQIVDRFGRLRLLFLCLVLYAIGGTTGLYLNDLYLILVGRLILGIGVAGTMTVSATLIGDYFAGKEREAFMGFEGAFMSFGGVIFVGTGGLLADVQWRYPFSLYFFSLLVLGLAAVYLFEPPKAGKSTSSSDSNKGTNPPLPSSNLAPARFNSKHWMLFGTGFLVMVIFYMIPVQIPFLLKSIGVEKSALAGLAIVFLTASGTITSLLYKWIRYRLSFPSVFVLMSALIAAGFTVVSFILCPQLSRRPRRNGTHGIRWGLVCGQPQHLAAACDRSSHAGPCRGAFHHVRFFRPVFEPGGGGGIENRDEFEFGVFRGGGVDRGDGNGIFGNGSQGKRQKLKIRPNDEHKRGINRLFIQHRKRRLHHPLQIFATRPGLAQHHHAIVGIVKMPGKQPGIGIPIDFPVLLPVPKSVLEQADHHLQV